MPTAPMTWSTRAISQIVLRTLMGASLSREGESGRVIRAVDDRVTAHARPAHHELERSGVTTVGARRMPGLDVTLLAQPRLCDLQHALVVGAVGVVAVRAALVDRRVHPEERASLLGMAGEAGVVERDFFQQ